MLVGHDAWIHNPWQSASGRVFNGTVKVDWVPAKPLDLDTFIELNRKHIEEALCGHENQTIMRILC